VTTAAVLSNGNFVGTGPVVLNEFFEGDGDVLFEHACKLGCGGIVSKRLGSTYRSGRSAHWIKVKNPKAPAVKREAEEDWGH
jgi:ATP-dependent DNA ligase